MSCFSPDDNEPRALFLKDDSFTDLGVVQDFTLEPLPPDPRADEWLEMLELLKKLVCISFSIKPEELPKWIAELCPITGELRLYGPSPIQQAVPVIYDIETIKDLTERLKAQLIERGLLESRTGQILEEVQE